MTLHIVNHRRLGAAYLAKAGGGAVLHLRPRVAQRLKQRCSSGLAGSSPGSSFPAAAARLAATSPTASAMPSRSSASGSCKQSAELESASSDAAHHAIQTQV